jgi:hypothetical protein
LLSNTFLARDKEDNKEMYYFIISFKKYFDEYFDVMHYELILDREVGAVQLVHRDHNNLLRLKKDESIIILILRILFHEHLVKTSINDNVVIKVDDIHDYYDSLELKKKINKTDLVKILRLFKRYNLIETLGDITKSSTPIIIYPTILLAINTQTINDVYNIIQHYESNNGSDKNEETH